MNGTLAIVAAFVSLSFGTQVVRADNSGVISLRRRRYEMESEQGHGASANGVITSRPIYDGPIHHEQIATKSDFHGENHLGNLNARGLFSLGIGYGGYSGYSGWGGGYGYGGYGDYTSAYGGYGGHGNYGYGGYPSLYSYSGYSPYDCYGGGYGNYYSSNYYGDYGYGGYGYGGFSPWDYSSYGYGYGGYGGYGDYGYGYSPGFSLSIGF